MLRLPDLVAAGDYLLHGEHPVCTLEELQSAVESARGARGARRLTDALPLLDGRAESPPESFLRLILLAAGVQGIEPNFWVTLVEPRKRYRIDIAIPDSMIGIEYQGEYHHDIDQWREDMTRLSRLRAAGWTMVEVSVRDLDDPTELAHRIRSLIARCR